MAAFSTGGAERVSISGELTVSVGIWRGGRDSRADIGDEAELGGVWTDVRRRS
jgi:hypothetical protein